MIMRYPTLLIMAVALLSCAPTVQKLGHPSIEPELAQNGFLMPDGTVLPFRTWQPEADTRAIVIAVHGFNDYSDAFTSAGTYWADQGIITYAYDQRGFGRTASPGIWADKDALSSDLKTVLKLVREAHPEASVTVLGVSMGAAVLIHTFSDSEHSTAMPNGMVLVSPAVWHGGIMSPIYRSILWLGAHIMPGRTATGRNLNRQASDNIEMLRALGRDPLVIKKTRIDAVYGLVGLMRHAYDEVEAMPGPVLALYGTKDEIVPVTSLEGIEARLPQHDQIWYAEGYHMLLRDLQAETVWRDISDWITRLE